MDIVDFAVIDSEGNPEVVGEDSKAAAEKRGGIQARSMDVSPRRNSGRERELLSGRNLNSDVAVAHLGVAIVETALFTLIGGGGLLLDWHGAGDSG
jgi:hypothetical protein